MTRYLILANASYSPVDIYKVISIDVENQLHRFSHIKPPLNTCDKLTLLSCIENEKGCNFPFFSCILSDFGIGAMLVSYNELGGCVFLYCCLEEFAKSWIICSFKNW